MRYTCPHMLRTCLLLSILLLAAPTSVTAITPEERKQILARMDSQAEHFGAISRKIWEFAEVGYKEHQSSALLREELQRNGFTIASNIGEIPTAFTATWGSGKPVIAILGEFDALPGLSQDTAPDRKPIKNGAPGHGCGHNLFGTGSALAAIEAKAFLQAKKLPGTIRFYGTPAEEGGGGKIHMARAGVFKDVDVALHWHPGTANRVTLGGALANINAKFRFYGKASHAAGAPDKGRSSLDALLLMAHAVDMLREHVPQETRIHYIVTNGGAAPNVVPDFAEGYFYARHPDMSVLDGIWARLIKCAEAGALATETRMEMEIVNAVYNILPNESLSTVVDRQLQLVGGVKYTPEEQKFAEALTKTFPPDFSLPLGSQEQVQPMLGARGLGGSTDVGDISWIVPTAGLGAATAVPGTPGHSWQNVACSGSSIGRKGMMVAAKTLALATIELLQNPKAVQDAKTDFERAKGSAVYQSRVPAGQKAPLNYRDNARAIE
jgi:aminobenzoyl-glutamate utilization protein B